MREQHDAIAKDVLAFLLINEGTVETEKVIAPKDAQRVDLLFMLDAIKRAAQVAADHGAECMQLLRQMTASLYVMLEAFSSVITFDAIVNSLRKQISLYQEMCRQARKARRPKPPFPTQWLLSAGKPAGAFARARFRRDEGWPAGFYRFGGELNLWVVVLSELPKTRATLPLRLLGVGRVAIEAQAEIEAIGEQDPASAKLVALLKWIRYVVKENGKASGRRNKEQQMRFEKLLAGFDDWLMKEQKQAAERVRSQIEREARAAGRAEGRAEGKVEGKAEGKIEGKVEGKAESLLAILDARQVKVTKKLRAQIMACSDARLLDRWIRRAASASSVAEVLEVAN